MKNSVRSGFRSFHCSLALAATLLCAEKAAAVTSPYVTKQTNVPLNQGTNDTINGMLPYFNSHAPVEGSVGSLIDAVSSDTPVENVILGPDNTWIGVAWDFGDPGPGYIWRLDRADIWIAAADNLRKGYRADFSVSSTGDVNDFTVITNSLHWDGLEQNDQYNYIRYDFPNEFIAGTNASMDRYPVKGFRYLRLNSRGDGVDGTDRQSRFVEIDVWVSKVGIPPVITSVNRNTNGDVNLTWSAVSGASYAVEYRNDLNRPAPFQPLIWTNLQTVIADEDTASATDAATTNSYRFYRVVLQP